MPVMRDDPNTTPPFDPARLDALLDGAGIDVVVATSQHNVRYLLGSYSAFFASFDAIGVDRYLPAVILRRGRLGDAFAVGHPIDAGQHEVEPPWAPTLLDVSQSVEDTARLVSERLPARATVAVEQSFAPHRFVQALAGARPGVSLVEAAPVLEELRAVKHPRELALLRDAAELIVDALASAAESAPGLTKREIVELVHVEEARRGLDFEYCLIAAGVSFNRAPSAQVWEDGVLSLDSGGRREGYIGDLCRMAVRGAPSAQQAELLAEVRELQDAARRPIRAGALGREIYETAAEVKRTLAHGEKMSFVAHGMGLVPHEAPRLSAETPIRYPATHRDRPLEAGMVLSIETDLRVDGVGLIKLEDTVAVTGDGCEGYGDAHRDWIAV